MIRFQNFINLIKCVFHFLDFKDVAIFTLSKKGNSKLIHNGYMYVKLRRKEENDGARWECTERRNHQCKGKARTKKIGSKDMVQAYMFHNHPPSRMKDDSQPEILWN